MPETTPLVVTVILNWNGLNDTRECIKSLMQVDYANNRIVVVDNGSEGDDASALRREFGDGINLLELATNLGFAGGANRGISYALDDGADYVLLLNNDTIVDPAFVSALVDAAKERADVAAVCPKTYYFDDTEVIYSTGGSVDLWTATAKQIGRKQKDVGQFERIAKRDYADGVCILMPRRSLETVGLLDEDYFAYWEETDWCMRAREKGLSCYYVPNAKIWHKAARVQAPTNRYYFLFRRNALMFVRKRGTGLQVLTALLAHIFVFAPRYFLTHPTNLARAPAELKALWWHGSSNRQPRRPLL